MSRSKFVDTISELDGRSDPEISSYYVETSALKRIRASSVRSIGVVGLKGSGKTTLFRLLTENLVWEPKMIRFGLSPDRSEFESFVDRVNCLQFATSVRQGMALFLVRLIDESIKLLPPDERTRTGAWIKRKSALLKPGSGLLKLLGRFRGVSVLGCGLEIGAPEGGGRSFKIHRISAEEDAGIWDLLSDFQQYGIKIRIVLDDPDRLFTHDGKSDPHLLAGYILGTNEIAKRLDFVQFVHILKSNVFHSIREVEEIDNLPHDYFDYISWTEDELQLLVESRMKYAEVVETEIFERSLRDTVGILSHNIRNGPRDLLRYLEIILKSDLAAKVSVATIAKCNSQFKRPARRQMEAVYAALYDAIESFLAAVFGDAATLTYPEFRSRFLTMRLSSEPSGVDYGLEWLKTSDRAFSALVEAGTVDVRAEQEWRKPFEPGYFQFDATAKGAEVRKTSVFV